MVLEKYRSNNWNEAHEYLRLGYSLVIITSYISQPHTCFSNYTMFLLFTISLVYYLIDFPAPHLLEQLEHVLTLHNLPSYNYLTDIPPPHLLEQ